MTQKHSPSRASIASSRALRSQGKKQIDPVRSRRCRRIIARMGQSKDGRARRREISTTAYFDELLVAYARKRGVGCSEAIRHLQLIAEMRSPERQRLSALVNTMKTEALAIGRESGDRYRQRVNAIVRAASEVLALL